MKLISANYLGLLALLTTLFSCSETEMSAPAVTNNETPSADQNPISEAVIGDWGVALDSLSETVNPGDDFFQYVNEGWLETAEYPSGVPRIDSFTELAVQAESDIKAIVNEAVTSPDNFNLQLISSFYESYMDVETLDALDLQPLQPKLEALFSVQNHQELIRIMQLTGFTAPVNFGVDIDTADPSSYILKVAQGGLGLPSREYYLLEESPYPEHRSAYQAYIEDLFTMADMNEQLPYVADIVSFETALAESHWSNAEMRDPVSMTRYVTISELQEYAPGMDWLEMLNSVGFNLAPDTTLVLNTDTAVADAAQLFANTSLDVLKAYMVFHLLDTHASLMGEQWSDRQFAFRGTQLQGLNEQRSREDNAVMLLNRHLGEVVGEEYVSRHFPPSYREVLMTYIDYLKDAFAQRFETRDWMDEETKAQALNKLSMLNAEIGYPTQWHDFSSLQLSSDTLIGNVWEINEWHLADTVSQLDEPVRQWEWGNNPQEINAYYSPAQNEIVFLAAILQPPFFDPNADFAVNFGSILGVIGHETSHGFDDQGSQYDGIGRLRNWWSEESAEEFKRRGDLLVAQFDSYEPLPGAHVNGRLTLGENMADLGGISVAHHALMNYIADQYPDGAPVLDGYTAEQRFFLAWAQMWRGKRTEGYARELLLRDPHSPSQYRANGTVRNLDAWYDAFDIGQDADLYLPPEERVTTW